MSRSISHALDPSSPQKSTIVRSNSEATRSPRRDRRRRNGRRGLQASAWRAGLGVFRFAAGSVSRFAPSTATRLAEKLFLTPPRHKAPAREVAWTEGATQFAIQFKDIELRAWSWGADQNRGADAPTALLVHGWGGRGSQMGAFAAPLVAAGYRVVTFDGPGHGASPGRRSSLPEMAEAVAAVLRHLGGADALIAHSIGAAATSAALGGFPGLPKDVHVGRIVYVGGPAVVEEFTGQFSRATGLSLPVVRRMQGRIEQRFGVRWSELDGRRLAPCIARPLLAIHDRDDREVACTESRALVAAWPGAELVETQGLGHRRILRDEDVVEQAVAFLTRRAPEAAPKPKLRADSADLAFGAATSGYHDLRGQSAPSSPWTRTA